MTSTVTRNGAWPRVSTRTTASGMIPSNQSRVVGRINRTCARRIRAPVADVPQRA